MGLGKGDPNVLEELVCWRKLRCRRGIYSEAKEWMLAKGRDAQEEGFTH